MNSNVESLQICCDLSKQKHQRGSSKTNNLPSFSFLGGGTTKQRSSAAQTGLLPHSSVPGEGVELQPMLLLLPPHHVYMVICMVWWHWLTGKEGTRCLLQLEALHSFTHPRSKMGGYWVCINPIWVFAVNKYIHIYIYAKLTKNTVVLPEIKDNTLRPHFLCC